MIVKTRLSHGGRSNKADVLFVELDSLQVTVELFGCDSVQVNLFQFDHFLMILLGGITFVLHTLNLLLKGLHKGKKLGAVLVFGFYNFFGTHEADCVE